MDNDLKLVVGVHVEPLTTPNRPQLIVAPVDFDRVRHWLSCSPDFVCKVELYPSAASELFPKKPGDIGF